MSLALQTVVHSATAILFGQLFRVMFGKLALQIPITISISFFTIAIYTFSYFTAGKLRVSDCILEFAKQMLGLNQRLLVDVFVPPLVFVSAFQSDFHIVVHEKLKVFLLAVPGVLANAGILSLAIYPAYKTRPFSEVFVYSAVLSATDPVSIVSILSQLSSLKILSTLIEGESLFNDASVVILVEIFGEMQSTSKPPSFFLFLVETLLRKLVVGLTVSAVLAFVVQKLFFFLKHKPKTALLFLLSSAYLVYLFAEETLHSSGLLATVFYGLFLAKDRFVLFTAEEYATFHELVETFVSLYEELLFYFTSVFVFAFVLKDYLANSLYGAAFFSKTLYVFVASNLARFATILFLAPALRFTGYPVSWQKLLILCACGVRGVVSISLVLSYFVASSDEVIPSFFAIYLLSLLVNSLFVKLLVRLFGFDKPTSTDVYFRVKTQTLLAKARMTLFNELKRNPEFKLADWNMVDKMVIGFQRKKTSRLDPRVLEKPSLTHESKEETVETRVSELKRQSVERDGAAVATKESVGLDLDSWFFRLLVTKLYEMEGSQLLSVSTSKRVKHLIEFAEDKNDAGAIVNLFLEKNLFGPFMQTLIRKEWLLTFFSSYIGKVLFQKFEELTCLAALFDKALASLQEFQLAEVDNSVYVNKVLGHRNILLRTKQKLENKFLNVARVFYSSLVAKLVLVELKTKLRVIYLQGLLKRTEFKCILAKLDRNLSWLKHNKPSIKFKNTAVN